MYTFTCIPTLRIQKIQANQEKLDYVLQNSDYNIKYSWQS